MTGAQRRRERRALECHRSKSFPVVMVALLAAVAAAASAAAPDAVPDPATLLQSAFDKRFNFDVVQVVEIETDERGSTVRRVLQMAMKHIDGRRHGLGYIVEPTRLRDTRLLTIENRDRSDDFFIYLPSEDKVRRVTSSRRADSFLGTGLQYEDLERRHASDYDVEDLGPDDSLDEPVRVIAARPRYDSGHDVALYHIATRDHAIREVRYYRGDRERLLRVQRVPREAIVAMGDYLVPTRIEVEDRRQRSTTRVVFSQITVDAELEDRLFTRSAVELGRPIPYLGDGEETASVGGSAW